MLLYFSFKTKIAFLNTTGQALGVLAPNCLRLLSVQVRSLSEAGSCSAACPMWDPRFGSLIWSEGMMRGPPTYRQGKD